MSTPDAPSPGGGSILPDIEPDTPPSDEPGPVSTDTPQPEEPLANVLRF